MASAESPGSYMSCEQARAHYDLATRETLFAPPMHNDLRGEGVSQIDLSHLSDSFAELTGLFEEAINDDQQSLGTTSHKVDSRHGHDAGYERKKQQFDSVTNLQTQDGKHTFHFNESANARWQAQFHIGPAALKAFLEAGYELHSGLTEVARANIALLEETHPHISSVYFPSGPGPRSLSFMRVLTYDGYDAAQAAGVVAKPHFDVSAFTIQAFADAPGFWGSFDKAEGQKKYHESQDGQGQLFVGTGYQKLYGHEAVLKQLYHGVDRVTPEGVQQVPRRHAIILFVNAPYIDPQISHKDTLPQLAAG